MKINLLIALLSFNLFIIVKSEDHKMDLNDLKEEINSFTLHYINKIIKFERSNIAFSPHGIFTILSIMNIVNYKNLMGDEIKDFIYFRQMDIFTYSDTFLKMLDEINLNYEKSRSAKLILSTSILFNKSVEIDEEFSRFANKYYHTDVLKLNIPKDKNFIKEKFNSYLSNISNKRINNIINDINARDLFDIFNINYFVDRFKIPFKTSLRSTFKNLNRKSKLLHMIQNIDYYYYGKEDNFEILRLDYQSNASMYLILPNKGVHINKVLKKLPDIHMENLFRNLKKHYLKVLVPVLQMKINHNMAKYLPSCKIRWLFSEKYFKNISKTENLHINKIKQYNIIDFKASGKYINPTFSYSLFKTFLIDFELNRPFAFILRICNVTMTAGVIKNL